MTRAAETRSPNLPLEGLPPNGSAHTSALDDKHRSLVSNLRSFERVAVALSGGIDSTLLLHACVEALGTDHVVAYTSVSVTTPKPDLSDAESAAEKVGVEHVWIETNELEIEAYSENSPSRCYFCKDELYQKIGDAARARGIDVVVDGTNADDRGDHRPGHRAARELGVRSPLLEAELTKDDVRGLAKRYGVEIWSKPASACLSSRFPYGTRIVREDVEKVGRAEAALRELGIEGGRVRHYGDMARIEIPPERIADLAGPARHAIVAMLKAAGYRYVTLDLEGYRSGSLNEGLAPEVFEA